MKLGSFPAALAFLMFGLSVHAQITSDALGVHNLGPGSTSPLTGSRPDPCAYCHAAHSGLNIGLWNQKLTTQTYTTTYGSSTEVNTFNQPALGHSTNQCLSCHDGSVAVGTTMVYGQVTTRGAMNDTDVFRNSLQSSHPFSLTLPLKDKIHLAASLVGSGKTLDPTGAVTLIQGNVECISCHNPHIEARDLLAKNFLVRDSSSGQMCLACHDPARQIGGQVNPLIDWTISAHAQSSAKVAPAASVGPYPTVAANACISCHAPHNAPGGARILRGANEQDCIACHNGANVSPMPQYANVFAEYASTKVGHPFPSSTSPHDAKEDTLLNNNRHATCVDCHSSHGSQIVGVFPSSPLLRISQKNIAGISAIDGTSILTPAVNQYENCLRCHGSSAGKQVQTIYGYFPVRAVSSGDPLNIITQFAISATSSHPVTHTRNSSLAQPSLLTRMLNIDGTTQGRAMGTQILCTDCHNSDDNREFGGAGANGPHGSKWLHILERRYEFNTAVMPGGQISNPFLGLDLTAQGPYGMCAKCHDLPNQIMKNTSWNGHSSHITAGMSCSTCHTAHGMGAASATISGERLVNFDVNVVGRNGNRPISYHHNSNSCTLTCHQYAHNPNGSVTKLGIASGAMPANQ